MHWRKNPWLLGHVETEFFSYSSFQNHDASLPVSILPASRLKEKKKKPCCDRPSISSIVSRPNDTHSWFWGSSFYEVSPSTYIANRKTRSLHNLIAKIRSIWENLPLSIASSHEHLVVNISAILCTRRLGFLSTWLQSCHVFQNHVVQNVSRGKAHIVNLSLYFVGYTAIVL